MRRCRHFCTTNSCAGHREAGGIGDQAGEFGVLGEQGAASKEQEMNTDETQISALFSNRRVRPAIIGRPTALSFRVSRDDTSKRSGAGCITLRK